MIVIFSTGDILVYPSYGIVELLERQRKEIAGHKMDVYVLQTHEKKQQIMVPAQTAEKSGLRRPIKKKLIDSIYKLLKEQPAQAKLDWYDRYRINEEKLRSGVLTSVAEVVRDLWHLREANEKNSKEWVQKQEAMNYLAGELAYVEKKRKSEILEKIDILMKEKVLYHDEEAS